MYKQFIAGCHLHPHQVHKNDQQLVFTCSSLPSNSSSSLSIVSLWSQQVIHQTRFVCFQKHRIIIKVVLVVSRHKRELWPPSQLQLSLKAGDLSDQILGDQAAAVVRIAAKLRRARSMMVLQTGDTSSHDGTEVFFCPQLK